MDSQSKQDLVAGAAVLLMFLGAFMLPSSSTGLVLIGAGTLVVLFLLLKVLREDR
jgi:uncharacterized protein HemY